MQLKNIFNNLHYKKSRNIQDKLLILILSPITFIYSSIVNLRLMLYQKGILKKCSVNARVISFGNLTTGGTGKTPVAIEFAKYLSSLPDIKLALISRGYGSIASKQGKISIVKAGEDLLIEDPQYCGDEALMSAKNLSNVVVITAKNRCRAAEVAINEYNCNTILLDDAFQHLAINRDFNILLIDQNKLFGNNKLLPAGPLREPLSSLNRADGFIVVNKNPEVSMNQSVPAMLASLKKPVFFAQYEYAGFVKYPEELYFEFLQEKKIFAFAGIAQPEYLFQKFNLDDLELKGKLSFDDHHNYCEQDAKLLNSAAVKSGATAIITTEKDIIKLLPYLTIFSLPVYAIKIKVKLDVREILEKLIYNAKNSA